MNITEVPVNLVFDGAATFVSRAIIDLGRADVPEVRLLLRNAISGVDNLDDFTAVPLELVMDNGQRRRFALWRHEHNPPAQVAIQLPLDEEFQDALAGILTVWKVPAAALIWLDGPIEPRSKPLTPVQCRCSRGSMACEGAVCAASSVAGALVPFPDHDGQ
jgi:hypothetical protein